LVEKVRQLLRLPHLQYIDSGKAQVSKIAIGCGAAGEFLEQAAAKSADVLLIGETRFHTYLEAKALGVSLILPGHYASERFAMERLAERIATQFPELRCWASKREQETRRRKSNGGAIELCVPPRSVSVDGSSASMSAGKTVCRTSVALPAVPTLNV